VGGGGGTKHKTRKKKEEKKEEKKKEKNKKKKKMVWGGVGDVDTPCTVEKQHAQASQRRTGWSSELVDTLVGGGLMATSAKPTLQRSSISVEGRKCMGEGSTP